MSPMVRKTLAALASAKDGTLTVEQARKAAGATMRGHRLVRNRMVNDGLVEHAPYNGAPRLTITQEGRIALGALDEPCAICGGRIAVGDGADRRGDVTHDVCLEQEDGVVVLAS